MRPSKPKSHFEKARDAHAKIHRSQGALVPSRVTARTCHRARGTVSRRARTPASPQEFGPSPSRAHEAIWREPVGASTAPSLAATMHRALIVDWAAGQHVARSLSLRAQSVNVDDALSAYAFFSATYTFLQGYFYVTPNAPGGEALRVAALAAHARLEEALALLLASPDEHQAREITDLALDARNSGLAAVAADSAAGAGEEEDPHVRAEATKKLAGADVGPMLVLLLSRGVSPDHTKQDRWVRRVVFPPGTSRPCGRMLHLRREFWKVHGAHAQVFERAEIEFEHHTPRARIVDWFQDRLRPNPYRTVRFAEPEDSDGGSSDRRPSRAPVRRPGVQSILQWPASPRRKRR